MALAPLMILYSLMDMLPCLHASFGKWTFTVRFFRKQDTLSRIGSGLEHCRTDNFCLCHLLSGTLWEWVVEEKIIPNIWIEGGKNSQMVVLLQCHFPLSFISLGSLISLSKGRKKQSKSTIAA